MTTLGPRESAELIAKASQHVDINTKSISALAQNLLEQMQNNKKYIHFKGWKTHPLNPKVANKEAVDWIFLVDALNFSFWSVNDKEKYTVEYGGERHTGYWSLCAAVNRAIAEGVPITSARYCNDFTIEQARHIFRSDSVIEMPMIEERVAVMNEIGRLLLDRFEGSFFNCVTEAKGSGKELMKLVVSNFPCFKDEGIFDGQRVSFYKRAQILVADLWACFEGEGPGSFADIDSITMFADYRIPQTLVYFDIMSYSDELNQLLAKNHMFENGNRMEMEIRACSIWAVELLVRRINELLALREDMKGIHINSVLLDHFLWDYRRMNDAQTKHIPFHKVRCIYY